MDSVIDSLLKGVPVLLTHLSVALAVLLAGLGLYMLITPHKELQLIRAGNTAAAVSLGGAAVGLALPLAFCLAGSVNVWDILLWGIVTLIVQLITFRLVDLLLRDLPRRIEQGEMATAVMLTSIKLAVATLVAASVAV